MTYEKFLEKWEMLRDSEQLCLYLDCQHSEESRSAWCDFDEGFIERHFHNSVSLFNALKDSNVNLKDEYIKIDEYGNYQSASEYQVWEEAYESSSFVFAHPEIWKSYIE